MKITHGLGTIGFRWKSGLYIDFFRTPYLGCFIAASDSDIKIWVNLSEGIVRIRGEYASGHCLLN